MAKIEDFLKNLQKMDQNQLHTLLRQVTAGLTPAQQKKLGQMMKDPAALQNLQSKLRAEDLSALSSPEAIRQYVQRDDVQKRINEIL